MHAGIMAKGDADDLGFWVLGDPDAGVRGLVFVAGTRFGEDGDLGGARSGFVGLRRSCSTSSSSTVKLAGTSCITG